MDEFGPAAHWKGSLEIASLIHRHQLPIYHLDEMRANAQAQGTVALDAPVGGPIPDETKFYKIHDMDKHKLVAAMESVHFLALVDNPPPETVMDPHMQQLVESDVPQAPFNTAYYCALESKLRPYPFPLASTDTSV